jgi:hypothetical protein
MSVQADEILYYKSLVVSDAAGNGGRMSANEIVDGAARNVFNTVGESERTAGSTKYRKVFIKVANDDDLPGSEPKVVLDRYTLGDDIVTFIPGTQTDVQSAIAGTQYGAGKLDANVVATATTLDILVEDGTNHTFVNGASIRISDMADVQASGNEEFVTISGAPSVLGDVVSITFTPALANNYSASNTYVQRVYTPPADVEATIDNVVVTSAAGTFDDDFLLPDAIGGIEDVITATFTSATAFTLVGAVAGALGVGSVGAGAAPVNADFGKPRFVIQSAGFGGTFVAGNTIVFQTHPAAVPIWLKRLVPAGAGPFTANECVLALICETSAS